MQTVPSLIGTGTAIAAAASGLVFGQPAEPSTSSTTTTIIRQNHPRRKISFDRDLPVSAHLHSLPPSRAGATSESSPTLPEGLQNDTYSTAQTPVSRPPLSHYQRPSTTSKGLGRKLSLVKRRGTGSTTAEGRDSVSSNGSWIRRFAIRPLSQHGSSRSSIALDTPSVTYSHSSTAPILPRPQTSSPPPPRNKLVKRSPSVQRNESAVPSHTRSKSHLPTLRRPATSHQRSATLQQQFRTDVDLANLPSSPTTSFDQQIRYEGLIDPIIGAQPRRGSKSSGWISFFHSRRLTIGGGGVASRFSEASPRSRSVSGKRISLIGDEGRKVHLVKPRMVSTSSAPAVLAFSSELREENSKQIEPEKSASEVPPSRRSKRSFSMPFSSSSTSHWMSRSSSSLRRAKGAAVGAGAETEGEMGNHKRHVSAPISGAQIPVDQDSIAIAPAQLTIHPNVPAKQGPTNTVTTVDSAANVQPPSHKRNLSSPLPPLPRNSSFHVDLPRIGSPSGAAANHLIRPHQPSGSSTSSAAMSQLRASPHYERSSVVSGSESDTRGFASGDDDDTDMKSDTMYDSLRTDSSSRMRSVETPLDSVYDESPPSTAGNGRTTRLSMLEMLGPDWLDRKIVEEDENDATPIVLSDDAEADYTTDPTRPIPRLGASPSLDTVLVATKDFIRMSLDDDGDEDYWTVDEGDVHINALSPPSKNSSLNSWGVNPNVRVALANISGNEMLEPHGNDTRSDRPLSTLFDWIDTDKNDVDGNSSRPKTASGKQEVDARGGRAALRKPPAPAHIRSQSVPVLHDAPENSKPNGAKYGTWGLGSKPVSEDWDEDFEFGCAGTDNGDVGNNSTLFSVPESIRASQPSVKAHSRQIQELSFIVTELKRLCRQGRDMDMLNGPQKGLWKEAEGVIALASPDEEEELGHENPETISANFDAGESSDQLFDDGFDAASLGRLDAGLEVLEPPMSRIAVVRERHSPKRRSVFSPDDDIFGGQWPLPDDHYTTSSKSTRPRTPHLPANDPMGATRSVMEAMQRSISNRAHEVRYDKKVHFDTNSLRVLVRRAGELRDSLSVVLGKAEGLSQSPLKTPRHERNHDSSPAFTRVFEDPNASPQRRLIRSRGSSSILNSASSPGPPSSPLGRRLQPMTVS